MSKSWALRIMPPVPVQKALPQRIVQYAHYCPRRSVNAEIYPEAVVDGALLSHVMFVHLSA